MTNTELRDNLKSLINQYNNLNNSFPCKLGSQIGWRKIHEELMKLKPYLLENLGETDKDAHLPDILKDIYKKQDDGETLSEIENIAGNFIEFVNEVVNMFERMTGYSFDEKTDKELEVEEIRETSKQNKKSKNKDNLEIN